MNYDQLIERATSYMHRTDLTAQWPTFIAMAENYLFRELDLRELEVSATVTSVDGFIDLLSLPQPSGSPVTVPVVFGRMGRLTRTVNGVEYDIEYNNRTDSYTATSPITYSQENNKLRLFPASTGQTFKIYYTANMGGLAASAPTATNWLSLNAADLYVYTTCLEAAKWLRDGDQVIQLSQMVAPLMESVRNLSKRRSIPNRGGLRVRMRNPLI